MISFKGELKDYLKTIENEFILTIKANDKEIPIEELNSLKIAKNGLKIDICKWTNKRSLDSNAYLWVLLDKIADKVNSTKYHIYKQFVKDVGVFDIVPIKDEAMDRFIRSWQKKGIGWVCENLGKSKIQGYTNIIAYYGTSEYNPNEMARILNEVVLQAKELGIQTLDELELKKMAEDWEKMYENQTTPKSN